MTSTVPSAGGSAIAADLGARKIREELDAMMVLGIDPIQRLVVPRVLACMLVAVFLNGLVSVVGVSGGYVFNVGLQGVGIAERADRLVAVLVAAFFADVFSSTLLLGIVLGLLAVASFVTVLQRMLTVRRQALESGEAGA